MQKDKIMTKAGLTLERVCASLSEHLNATEEVEEFIDGVSTVKTVPLYSVQEKAQDKILRMSGAIKPDGAITVFNNSVTITTEEFKKLLETDRQMLKSKQSGEIIDVQGYRA